MSNLRHGFLALISIPLCLMAQGHAGNKATPQELQTLTGALRTMTDYRASARFSVSMAQLGRDVVYDLSFDAVPSVPGDTLEPVSYMLGWRLNRQAGPVEGFTAYVSPGALYRYDGHKLHEYHAETEPQSFAPGGDTRRGVHRAAQFTGLLPVHLADELDAPASNGDVVLSVTATDCNGAPCTMVRRTIVDPDGETLSEATYRFDADCRPLGIVYENNTGTVGEQSITVTYGAPADTAATACTSEQELLDRWPDVFSHGRDDMFRLLTLPGKPLPAFSAPTADGDRLTHTAGAPLDRPALIVFVDAVGEFTPQTLQAARTALDALPWSADLIIALDDANIEDAGRVAGPSRTGQTVLLNARKLARDCGVTACPVMLAVGSDGIVADVVPAFNNNLSTDVIRKMSPLAPKY